MAGERRAFLEFLEQNEGIQVVNGKGIQPLGSRFRCQ